MKVRMTFDFPANARQAIARHFGQQGLATRNDLARWVDMCVDSTLEAIMADHQQEEET